MSFATPNYFSLMEVLIESVHTFSTRPIIVYGIDADIPFSTEKYPRLIKRRLYDLQGDIYAQKSRIILESGLNYGIYVEADDIVNQGVDNLFLWCRKAHTYPLCPIHPKDPHNERPIMRRLGVTRQSMPYVHAHVLFSHECMPFIKEWHDLCVRYDRIAGSADETILNVLLWKYGVTKYLPVYDPWYEHYHTYLLGDPPGSGYDNIGSPIYYYMFHGCKDVTEAWHILHTLVSSSSVD